MEEENKLQNSRGGKMLLLMCSDLPSYAFFIIHFNGIFRHRKKVNDTAFRGRKSFRVRFKYGMTLRDFQFSIEDAPDLVSWPTESKAMELWHSNLSRVSFLACFGSSR